MTFDPNNFDDRVGHEIDWDAVDLAVDPDAVTDETEDEQLADAGYDTEYRGELDLDELAPHERDLYLGFYNSYDGDEQEAVGAFADWMERFEAAHNAADSTPDADMDAEAWIKSSGLTKEDWPEFEDTLEAVKAQTGEDVPFEDVANRALGIYQRGQDAIAEARGPEKYASYDDALTASFASGEMGSGKQAAAQAGQSDLRNSIDEWFTEHSDENAMRKEARRRVEIEAVERRAAGI
jgi:hypothetical protein